MADALGAGLQAGAGVIGSIIGMAGQSHANKMAFRQQKELLQMQQDWQHNENAHSILNQYAQYRQLGINPLALNGSMQQANQSSPSAPQSQYRNPVEGAQLGLLMSEMAKNFAEADKTRSEIPVNESQAALNWSNQQTVEALRDGQVRAQDVNIDLANSQKDVNEKEVQRITEEINKIQATVENLNANTYLSDVQSATIQFQAINDWLHNRAEEEHWSKQEQIAMRELSIKAAEVAQFVKESNARIQAINADIEKTGAETEAIKAQKELLQKEAEKLGIEIDFANATYGWRVDADQWNCKYQIAVAKNGKVTTEIDTKWKQENPASARDFYMLNKYMDTLNLGFTFGGFKTFGSGSGKSGNSGTGYVMPTSPYRYNPYSGQYGPIPGR